MFKNKVRGIIIYNNNNNNNFNDKRSRGGL